LPLSLFLSFEIYREHIDELGDVSGLRSPSAWKWICVAVIGVVCGICSWLLRNIIAWVFKLRFSHFQERSGTSYGTSWLWVTGFSVIAVGLSSSLVVLIEPGAASGGVPDVMAYINGVRMQTLTKWRLLAVKLLSCGLAVGSGLPVGPEGPVIHIGAMVGAIIASLPVWTTHVATRLGHKIAFPRFRNSKDHRDMTAAGAAAGVAAAFGAPIGGVIFAIEEIAGTYDPWHTWLMFFATTWAVFTQDIFGTVINAFSIVKGASFGSISDEAGILFGVQPNLEVNTHALAMVVAVLMGVMGGLFALFFTIMNLKINRFRNRYIKTSQFLSILEPCIIAAVVSSAAYLLMPRDNCIPIPYDTPYPGCEQASNITAAYWPTPKGSAAATRHGDCALGPEWYSQYTCSDGHYDPLASLFQVPGETALKRIFLRGPNKAFMFSAQNLVCFFLVYYLGAIWASGTMLSSGIVVPCLMIGACYGRAVGVVLAHVIGYCGGGDFLYTDTWAWLDPGALALLGSAAFFGGVSRLTVSLLVIMVEISNDVHSVLPMMIAVMTAKRIADTYTHGLYHAILELKCVPFLDSVPFHPHHDLELYQLKDVMTSDVISLTVLTPAWKIHQILHMTHHNAFAVVSEENNFLGSISRATCEVLLNSPAAYGSATAGSATTLAYTDMAGEWSVSHLEGGKVSRERASMNTERNTNHLIGRLARDALIDLAPYLNASAYCLPEVFSVKQAYGLFRACGLRHLFVLDERHRPVGVCTRKDFIGHDMENRLPKFPNTEFSRRFGSRRLSMGNVPNGDDRGEDYGATDGEANPLAPAGEAPRAPSPPPL